VIFVILVLVWEIDDELGRLWWLEPMMTLVIRISGVLSIFIILINKHKLLKRSIPSILERARYSTSKEYTNRCIASHPGRLATTDEEMPITKESRETGQIEEDQPQSSREYRDIVITRKAKKKSE
jgi:hypothetical protein